MPKREIRFCIHDGKGNRAATWKCWSPSSSGKNDVYIATRELGGAIKISFHQSGQCHLAYIQKYWEEQVPNEFKNEKGRYIYKWEVPEHNEAGCKLLFRVVTPYSSTSVPFKYSEYKKMNWVDNCPDGLATEVYFILALPGVTISGWPGNNAMDTKLIGSYELSDGTSLWLVFRDIKIPDLSHIKGRFKFYKEKRKRDLVEGNKKILVFGSEPDGSQVIYDCAMKTGPNKAVFTNYIRYLNQLERQGIRTTLPRGKFFDRFR